MPVLVKWKEWRGNDKRTDRAYFLNEESARKFLDGISKDREILDVEVIPVPMKDVV